MRSDPIADYLDQVAAADCRVRSGAPGGTPPAEDLRTLLDAAPVLARAVERLEDALQDVLAGATIWTTEETAAARRALTDVAELLSGREPPTPPAAGQLSLDLEVTP